ncbi:MAG: cytochrome b/b6 domain-containing protein [Actinomycetota bacterium]|nr:cytochrome b/b6 domain-containing protein [Actinomycetota bacterium]
MAATTRRSSEGAAFPSGPAGRLPRFDLNERVLHWVNAVLFLVLMATAAVLYVGPLSSVVGRRVLVRDIHVWTGLFLPVPYLVARIGPWSAGLRDDVRRLARFDPHDRRFVRTVGRDPTARLGKFHPGQKLNAAFTAGSIPVLLATGVVMRWFDPFPLTWRTGATFVHDWVALGLYVTVAVHIIKATSDGQAMSGMWGGTVSDGWARRRHPRWHEELTPAAPPPTPAPPPPRAL